METTHLLKDTPGPQGSTPDQPPPFLSSNVPDCECCRRPSVQQGRLQSRSYPTGPTDSLAPSLPEESLTRARVPSGHTAAFLSDVVFWFCSVGKIPIASCDQ